MIKNFHTIISTILIGIMCTTPLTLSCYAQEFPKSHLASLSTLQNNVTTKYDSLSSSQSTNVNLNQKVDEICRRYGVTGASIAAFNQGKIVYTHSYGNARPGQAANENTKYRIASISKAVTAALAMHLEEEGKLNLDDDIAKIHPNLQNPFYPDTKATLEMLMTHTSGIIDGAGYNSAISQSPFPSLDAVLQQNNFSGSKPGSQYAYSNFGMGLVSAAIEKASGQYFYDYAQETLFKPLGIDAAYLTNYIEDKQSLAALGSVDPLSWKNMKWAYDSIPLGEMYLLGQGELYISASDLAKIAMIMAGDGTYLSAESGQKESFLNKETLDKVHTVRVYDETTNTSRGLAFQMSDDIIDGVQLWGHQGNAYGVISCMFYDRESQKGVVFLTNNASSARAPSKVYAVNDAIIKSVWEFI